MFLNSDDGLAEAKLLLPGDQGFFAVMRKTNSGTVSSRCYPMRQLEDVVRVVRRTPDAFISQGTFVAKQRRVARLHQLRSAWVDIDCYNVRRTVNRGLLSDVMALATSSGIPKPSLLVRSGRGLYAKWIFETPIGSAKLLEWKALQNDLVNIYLPLGADPKARDAARVLRLLGTTNSKADSFNCRVEICHQGPGMVDFNDFRACMAAAKFSGAVPGYEADARYSWGLPNISFASAKGDATPPGADVDQSERIEPPKPRFATVTAAGSAASPAVTRATPAEAAVARTDISGLAAFVQDRMPLKMKDRCARSLNWRRAQDLCTLAKLRGGIHVGWRDEFTFWLMTFMAHSGAVNFNNFNLTVGMLSRLVDASGKFLPETDGSMGTLKEKVSEQQRISELAIARMKRQQEAAASGARPGPRTPPSGSGNNQQKPKADASARARAMALACPIYTASNTHLIASFGITLEEQRSMLTLICPTEKLRRRDEKHEGRAERRTVRAARQGRIQSLLKKGMDAMTVAREVGTHKREVYRLRELIARHEYKAIAREEGMQATQSRGARKPDMDAVYARVAGSMAPRRVTRRALKLDAALLETVSGRLYDEGPRETKGLIWARAADCNSSRVRIELDLGESAFARARAQVRRRIPRTLTPDERQARDEQIERNRVACAADAEARAAAREQRLADEQVRSQKQIQGFGASMLNMIETMRSLSAPPAPVLHHSALTRSQDPLHERLLEPAGASPSDPSILERPLRQDTQAEAGYGGTGGPQASQAGGQPWGPGRCAAIPEHQRVAGLASIKAIRDRLASRLVRPVAH